MPRAGGESDKLGNRYESVWTVSILLEVASGIYDWLCVESLEDDSTGIEFVARRPDGVREFHSAKRQRSDGEWTLAALSRPSGAKGRTILSDLLDKLKTDSKAECCFVSSSGANDLREIAERAQSRLTFEDFETDIGSSDRLRDSYNKRFLPLVSGDRAAAFAFLRRLRVVLIDERTLTAQVDQKVDFLVYRPDLGSYDNSMVRLLLGDFILENLGNQIRGEAIWRVLKSHGFDKRDWARDPTVLDNVSRRNQEYRSSIESELINGSQLARLESQVILDEIRRSDGAKTLLVSASAGMGKSCVLVQTVEELRGAGTPVLVVRMDRHGAAKTTMEIGMQMFLPQSPTVVLAGLANGGNCVLVIDQLDATSQLSGRYPDLWEVFDWLCREAANYPNMKMLVSCREFDLQHDHRLRRLKTSVNTKVVSIDLLTTKEVDDAIAIAGGQAAALSPKQKDLLRTPLHLYLFLESCKEEYTSTTFNTIGDLFDDYWRYKERKVRERLSQSSDWISVVDRLCEVMSEQLILCAPEAELDDWVGTMNAMLTEHVLARDGTQIRFFHESFFDYVFARRFLRSRQSLVTFLLKSEQHLFRRAQVRQILTFLRSQYRADYRRELTDLLSEQRIRFHIKRLVCAWLGSLTEPTREEWEIIKPLMENEQLQRHLLPTVRNSLPWFDLLDQLGVIAEWLESPDQQLVNRAIGFLMLDSVQKTRSPRAAQLLNPYRTRGSDWTNRLLAYFRFGNAHYSREIQELFLTLLKEGAFDNISSDHHDSWWNSLREAGKQAPLFALEAICCWLDLRMVLRPEDEQLLDGADHSGGAATLISDVANSEPREYIIQIFPRVLQMIRASLETSVTGHVYDRVWSRRTNFQPTNISESLLDGLVRSLQWLSREHPDELETLMPRPPAIDWHTVSFLLLRAWSANPARFAMACIDFLCGNPSRRAIGYFGTFGDGNGDSAISREAIMKCIPHATPHGKQQLEAAILDSPPPEDTSDYSEWRERLLLEAMGKENLSGRGKKRLTKLRIKFPDQDIKIPPSHAGGASFVGSPIPPIQTAAFTDEQWLEAMRQYDYGWEGMWRGTQKHMMGTAVELSRLLQPIVRGQRLRFANLAQRMDDTIRPEYFEAILDGVCSTANLSKDERKADDIEFDQIDTEVILQVVRRLHSLPGRPCGQSICTAISRMAVRPLPCEVMETLRYYAIEDPNPRGDDWRKHDTDPNNAVEQAHFYGYNSIRGQAARAISSLLFADFARQDTLVPILEHMVTDPSLAVRTCVIEALLPVLNHSRDHAVQLFCKLCQVDPLIIGTQPFEEFVRYTSSTHYSALREVLQAGLASSSERVQAAAARQICIAALSEVLAENDAAAVRTGPVIQRTAAAQVYAYNIGNAVVGNVCVNHVCHFFHDAAEPVRKEASHCFRHLNDRDLNQYVPMIEQYIQSVAFPSRYDDLLSKLEDSTWKLPNLTIRLAEAFLRSKGTDASNISTAAAIDAPIVSKLVVRLYSQSNDGAVRSKCLDLIDEMEVLGFYGIDSQLAEHDR